MNFTKSRTLNINHSDHVVCLAIINENTIATGSHDNTIKIWDIYTGEEIKTLKGHTDDVNCMTVKDEKTIISGGSDRTIIIWDLTSDEKQVIHTSHWNWITSLVFIEPDRIVSGDPKGKIFLSDTVKEIKQMKRHIGTVNCLKKLNEKMVLSGSDDGSIYMWDGITGDLVKTIIAGGNHIVFPVYCITVIDENTIVYGNDLGLISAYITHVKPTKKLAGHSTKKSLYVNKCIAHINHNTIVSGGWDGTVKIWDLDSEKEIQTLDDNFGKEHKGIISSIVVMNKNTIISSNASKDKLIVWYSPPAFVKGVLQSNGQGGGGGGGGGGTY